MRNNSRVFCSYAHNDISFFDELTVHLAALKRSGCIEMWSNRDIPAGGEWQKQVSDALEDADVILLLVSPEFIASDYCFEVEMKRALELAATRQALVKPILIRACDWTAMPFANLGILPMDRTPIGSRLGHERDEAWADIANWIRTLLGRQVRRRAAASPSATNSKEELLLRFLETWSSWGFNSARIRNWGGRQSGYEEFARMTAEQIRTTLENLARMGKVNCFQSSAGTILYKAVR